MERLPNLVYRLCLLRAGPQDLPFSRPLLRNLLVLALLVDVGYSWMLGVREGLWVLVLLSFAVGIGLLHGVLTMAGRRERFVQTVSAVLAVGVVFKLALLPLLFGILPLPDPGVAPTSLQGLLLWVTLGLLIWNLVVDGHIMRHALEIRLGQGILLALVLMVVQLALTHLLGRLLFSAPVAA